MEAISTCGENELKTLKTFSEHSRYRSGCPSTKIACGQSFAAVRSGKAECTPNFRASYDGAETTPRSCLWPPTTTTFPYSEGSNSSSTDIKNASISTWKMVRAKAEMYDAAAMLGKF